MDKCITDQVEELKYSTSTNLKQISLGRIPTEIEISMIRKYSYMIHGKYYSMYKGDSMLFVVKGLPYTPYQKRHTFQDTLYNLVRTQEIYPFLLFLDGKFIKWSDIMIIKDCKYSYILVSGFMRDECKINTILIPNINTVTYTESDKSPTNKLFTFDNNGKFVTEYESGTGYTTIDINDNDLILDKNKARVNTKVKSNIGYDYKVNPENLFIFKDGLFTPHDKYFKIYGLNVFSIRNLEDTTDRSEFLYLNFYYKKSNAVLDNDHTIINKDNVTNEMIAANGARKYLGILNQPFDFEFEKVYSYDRNINEALDYIMGYNPNLMNGMYKKISNVVVRQYTGKELLNLKAKNGYVTMSRRIDGCMDTYLIIFKNGELYRHYSELVYENKNFKFPLINVLETDNFEFVFFKNVDNRVFNFVFDSGADNYNRIIDSSIDLDNCRLFSSDNNSGNFNLEHRPQIQFEVEFTANKISKHVVNFRPVDPYYLDKKLSLVSNRQFRYYFTHIQKNCISITLSDDFKFCIDENKYMVFLNGRKLTNAQYRLTIPKVTRPFDELCVYITKELVIGDKVEVVYAGDDLTEIYNSSDLDLSGNIVLDKSKMMFGFDKDIHMVFVNGKKIPNKDLVNISNDRLQIITDTNSTKNVSIVRCVEGNEFLSELYLRTEDALSSLYNKLPKEIIDQLFKAEDMSNIDEDIMKDSISKKFVLTKIIRKFWARPFINTDGPLLYDYDEDGLDKDMSGNVLLSQAFNGDLQYDEHYNELQ